MNIKSLLIGSAAALVAVSGARAADAVVAAEPEAMEYVRVCDAYGAGYFYIPGTETCLKVGGFARYQIDGVRKEDNIKNIEGKNEAGVAHAAKARLIFEAKNESEIGTVSSYIRFDSTTTGAKKATSAAWDNQYSLGVGGLEMGYRTAQWSRFSGDGGFTDHGGNYGDHAAHYISYTFATDAFSAIVSLDNDDSANYMPDVMAGVSGKFGSLEGTVSVGYDESAYLSSTGENKGEFAVKATTGYDFEVAKLRLVGFYAAGYNSYWYSTAMGTNNESTAMGVIAGVSAPVGEKLNLALDVSYDKAKGGKATTAIIGDVKYKIASGLDALVEVRNQKTKDSKATTDYFIRFERSF
jgi:hypothetical protein